MVDTEQRPDSEIAESENPGAAAPENMAASDLDTPLLSASEMYQEEAGGATGPDPAESIGAARAVPVTMFDYEYNIMSDKPRLVEILAGAIDREARRIKANNPGFNRGSFNWPVEVAFKMALDRYYAQRALAECRQELEALTARVESDAEKLAGLIEAGLEDTGFTKPETKAQS